MSTEGQPQIVLATRPERALSQRFADKVALVTGASDRGIGGAIAERLAAEGAAISMISRHEPDRLMQRLRENSAAALFTTGDVARTEDVAHVVETTIDRFGQIDVLVNNAGIELAEPLATLSDEQWTELLQVNLTGVLRMSRAVLEHMDSRGGAIVNIASVLGLAGSAGLAAYSATKAGVIGMTQSLALELAPKGIRVVAVAPAMVKTPMATRYAPNMTAEVWERIQQSHPLGIGRPADVAAAVAFLASDEARWITGITLPMGWTPAFPLPVDDMLGR